MKSRKRFYLLSLFIFITFFRGNVFSHDQRIHQYIVREGYSLLKKYLGDTDIMPLMDKIGTIHSGFWMNYWPDHGAPWGEGKVVTGAFREDEEDPVFKYGSDVTVWPTRMLFATLTHFWQADFGDDALSNLDWGGMGIPNAFQKVKKYLYGGWDFNWNPILYCFPTHSDGTGCCATQRAVLTMRYTNIIDLYKNGNLYVTSVTRNNGSQTVFDNPIKLTSANWSLLNSYNFESFLDAVVFEILGRACHLLADMSIPAHTHNKSHPPPGDPFENAMGVDNYDEWVSNEFIRYWDANRVWNVYGNIMYPYINYDTPIRHLMYTLNQLTNHFACEDRYGNDNFSSNNQELNDYFPYGIPPVTPQQYIETTYFGAMRDTLFPHAIRATAGLLYWFSMEADFLPNIQIINNFGAGKFRLNSQDFYSGHRIRIIDNAGPVSLEALDQTYDNCYWRFQNWEKFKMEMLLKHITQEQLQ